MTQSLSGEQVANRVREVLPNAVVKADGIDLYLRSEAMLDVCRFLKEAPDMEMDYLTSITGVDYMDYLEVVYHLTSIARNHSVVVKTKLYDRAAPELPSVISLWQGAEFQEREVYDFFGIIFTGHPDLRRILMWDGYANFPLRKDYLGLNYGQRPALVE
ncbi:MAG: NADH-quinone oxidoreductase subunit C [Chloroflexi bacterium]|nr:NADH-quinone oxidoreductase subunit C [Chloroflexota bacterium]